MDDNEREVVRSVLRSKLTEEELNLFGNTDLDPLARNGLTLASIFATADENSLKEVLPGRLGLVRLLLARFVYPTLLQLSNIGCWVEYGVAVKLMNGLGKEPLLSWRV